MNKYIVITSIYPVSRAVEKFQMLDDWNLIVVGDRKTPHDYHLKNGVYLSPEAQERYDKKLSDAIGWNRTARRSFGFLWAYEQGADVVATVDDDNIPYSFWGKCLSVGQDLEVNYYETELPVFDPVGATEHSHLWHRGFPLELVSKRAYGARSKKKIRVDIQADFWNGDPDIDSLCRMLYNPKSTFDPQSFPISSNKPMPFNSQNTFISRHALKHYFLFPTLGRMSDIWASYYLQFQGYNVVFKPPSVQHCRNIHDHIEDLKEEYLGYEQSLNLVEDLSKDSGSIHRYIRKQDSDALGLYQAHFS